MSVRKLIAIDFDGTILNSNHEISEENIRAIKKAMRQGHIVMILTGRQPESIREELAKYGLDLPFGANNGTEVYADGKLLERTALTPSQNKRVAFAVEEENVPYKISTNMGVFAPKNWSGRLEKVLSSGRVPQEYLNDVNFEKMTQPPEKLGQTMFERIEEFLERKDLIALKYLILAFDPEQKSRLLRKLASIEEITITHSAPFNIEVMNRNGNKGNGLKVMANYYRIPLENTVAIGDEANDIAMFKTAGLAIAMGNAPEEVRKAGDAVTLSNDENGVAYAIENFVLKD